MNLKSKNLTILILIFIPLLSCERKDDLIDGSNLLIGNWINPQFTDTIIQYRRSGSLKENDYGFSFKNNGKFTERKNSGWCGTPPVIYSDYDGTWSVQDSLIRVSTGFWGGTVNYQWKIVALDKDYLSLYIVKQEYKHENK